MHRAVRAGFGSLLHRVRIVRCDAYWWVPSVPVFAFADGEAERALVLLLGEQCRLYNAALEERRGAWRLERRSVTRFEQYKTLTGLADQEPALLAFGVTVARGTLLRLDRAFQGFFRRAKAGQAPGFPRFRSARRFDSVEWPDASGWKLDETAGRVYLRGVGHVKLRLHRSLRGTPKTITVARVGRRWQVTVFCTGVPAELLPATGKAVGVDVGVTVAAALSDGRIIDNPRHLRRSADALAAAQRVVSRRRRGSRRRAKAGEAVAARHRKIANQRRDFLHKQSRALVNDHDVRQLWSPGPRRCQRRGEHPSGRAGPAPRGEAKRAAA